MEMELEVKEEVEGIESLSMNGANIEVLREAWRELREEDRREKEEEKRKERELERKRRDVGRLERDLNDRKSVGTCEVDHKDTHV